jgi:hypothetical protein
MDTGNASRIRLVLPADTSVTEDFLYAQLFETGAHPSGLKTFEFAFTGSKGDLAAAKSQMDRLDTERLRAHEAAWTNALSHRPNALSLPMQAYFPDWLLPAEELASYRRAVAGSILAQQNETLEHTMNHNARRFAEGDITAILPMREGGATLSGAEVFQPLSAALEGDRLTIRHLSLPVGNIYEPSRFDTQHHLIRGLAGAQLATGFMGQVLAPHPEGKALTMEMRTRTGYGEPLAELLKHAFHHTVGDLPLTTLLVLDGEEKIPPRMLVSPAQNIPGMPLSPAPVPQNLRELEGMIQQCLHGRYHTPGTGTPGEF